MATIILPVEQRKHEWPDDDKRLQSDQALRDFFSTFSRQYQNADIVRKTNGNTLEITITPRAGQKGSTSALHVLLEAPEEISPALCLAWQLEGRMRPSLDIKTRLERYEALEALADEAEAQHKIFLAQVTLLKASQPSPASLIPIGF